MHVILGDLHGNFDYLRRAIAHHPEWDSVTLVGDLGAGFPGCYDPPFKSPINIRFIRGNHDNPEFVKRLPVSWHAAYWGYIPDGSLMNGVLYLGGAWSIDYERRTPGLDWWPDEEIGFEEMENIADMLRGTDSVIHTVVSHDCPQGLSPYLYPGRRILNSVTASWLEYLRRDLLVGPKKPTRWYFGHHHRPWAKGLDGVLYRCLDEAVTGDSAELTIWGG